MSILAWLVLGLIAGSVASRVVSNTGEGTIVDVLLGIAGAIIGGWLFHSLGAAGITSLNLYSVLVAMIGASIILILYHASFRGSVRERQRVQVVRRHQW